jgi:hypothetical protein
MQWLAKLEYRETGINSPDFQVAVAILGLN